MNIETIATETTKRRISPSFIGCLFNLKMLAKRLFIFISSIILEVSNRFVLDTLH